jgi:hypothetical protein
MADWELATWKKFTKKTNIDPKASTIKMNK